MILPWLDDASWLIDHSTSTRYTACYLSPVNDMFAIFGSGWCMVMGSLRCRHLCFTPNLTLQIDFFVTKVVDILRVMLPSKGNLLEPLLGTNAHWTDCCLGKCHHSKYHWLRKKSYSSLISFRCLSTVEACSSQQPYSLKLRRELELGWSLR